MEEKNKMTRVFSGTEITVKLLQDELEKIGVPTIVQNDFQSGVLAGFSGGGPYAVDLLIREEDIPEAEPIIKDFRRRQEG